MLLAQQSNEFMIKFTMEPLWHDKGIPLAIMGVLVVFSALVLVVTFISVLPRVLNRFSEEEPGAAASFLDVGTDELPEQILVVIAAAVAQAFDQPHRIVRIRGLTPADLGWSLEGRMQHHQSHKIQHRGRQ
jgi:Na+-transporting methylmalonyl-CoA/oxaloacetate decarboxylase gamma subunit